MPIMRIEHTKNFQKLRARNSSMKDMLVKFAWAENSSEFMLLADICGFRNGFPPDLFVLLLSSMLIATNPEMVIVGADAAQSKRFLDVVYTVLVESSILDKAVKSKRFINTCGRWMAKGYVREDKTIFLKLAKILGHAASKLMGI